MNLLSLADSSALSLKIGPDAHIFLSLAHLIHIIIPSSLPGNLQLFNHWNLPFFSVELNTVSLFLIIVNNIVAGIPKSALVFLCPFHLRELTLYHSAVMFYTFLCKPFFCKTGKVELTSSKALYSEEHWESQTVFLTALESQ